MVRLHFSSHRLNFKSCRYDSRFYDFEGINFDRPTDGNEHNIINTLFYFCTQFYVNIMYIKFHIICCRYKYKSKTTCSSYSVVYLPT